MGLFSKLFHRKNDEDSLRRFEAELRRSHDLLDPPDLGITYKCECGVWHKTNLNTFYVLGGVEVMCADCHAVYFIPPEILDHAKYSATQTKAELKPNWQQYCRFVRHSKQTEQQVVSDDQSQSNANKGHPKTNQLAGEENYHRAIGLANQGKWPEAMEELKQAVNRGHAKAVTTISRMWCSQCRIRIAQPSSSKISDYSRFWMGKCPRCQNQMTFDIT